jgi:SAM-dependent methyltransferase
LDIVEYNKQAWDRKVSEADRWTVPVSAEAIEQARGGQFEMVLTPTIPVPRSWFPDLKEAKTLCLAAAGGQQAPLLAAAGAVVTVFDNSPMQLQQDKLVAERAGLSLERVQGDMRDLSMFADGQFDFIFHPCSNTFVPDVVPVWREAARVLRPGGLLLSGFTNPVRYIFDDERTYSGQLVVRHALPYSDMTHLSDDELKVHVTDPGHPFEFGHTLDSQIGEQLRSGFVMTDFYEDRFGAEEKDPISQFMNTFMATRCERR